MGIEGSLRNPSKSRLFQSVLMSPMWSGALCSASLLIAQVSISGFFGMDCKPSPGSSEIVKW